MTTRSEIARKIPNPYDALLDALWGILEADGGFRDLVPIGNRIKFSGRDREPMKENVSEADLPEVRIIITGSRPHPKRTSSSHCDTVTVEIQVSSGDQRLSYMHNPIRWVVYRAMSEIETELRHRCRWNGQKIAKVAAPTKVSDGVSTADLNRGIKGWSAVWACDVELWFERDLTQ